MKILFFARRFYPEIGGVEKHVLEIGKILVKRGYKVIVVAENVMQSYSLDKHSKSLSARTTGEVDGIEFIKIDPGSSNWFKKFRIWKELWSYRDLIKKSDIVHCQDVFFWYLPFKFLFPFKPVFTTFHGYEGNYLPTKKAILMHKLAEKLSKGNICVGDYLKKWYGTNPNVVTYGAIRMPKPFILKHKNNSITNVLYIGRLEEEAGILVYLEVLNYLKQKNINLNLTVLGDGAQRRVAEQYVKKNRLNVTFKGFVKEVYDYLPSSDIVFTSRYLGTLEAFIFKKMVFAVFNNEIKKDCYTLSPFKDFVILEKNPAILAEKVMEYIASPNLIDEKTEKAYIWVKKQTWDKMVDNYLSLWQIN